MSSPSQMNRRSFLGLGLAGAWTLGFALHGERLQARLLQPGEADAAAWQPDLFLSLAEDGELTIVSHRSEMGTGIGTSLPMVLADEMEADWARVTITQADGDARFGSQNTDGSRSIRNFHQRMREAGATARMMLLAAAAEQWGVPRSRCYAELHEVRHRDSDRRLGYGALAATAAKQAMPKAEELAFKEASQWRYIGKDVPIRDLEDILHGSAVFGLDIRLPDMLTAVIARPPVLGGRAASWQDQEARKLPGVVEVIELPTAEAPFGFQALGGIAVVARDTWSALEGRKRLQIEWEHGPLASADTAQQEAAMLAAVRQPGQVIREQGDAAGALDEAEAVLSAEYQLPHLAHAPMEPPCATARVDEDGAELWMPTQNPQAAQGSVAAALNLPPNRVTVHVTLLGGGFGRKSKPDYGVEAALLARAVGKPVQVFWTREDDIRHDYFHAAAAMRFEALLGDDGLPTAWRQRSAFTPIGFTFNPEARQGSPGELDLGFTDMPFTIPNLAVENGPATPHLRIGWLRSVCNIFHAFGVSSFADELAAASGADPAAYLKRLIGSPRLIGAEELGGNYGNYGASLEQYPVDTGRLLATLDRALDRAGWKERRHAMRGSARPWQGIGVAAHRSFLGYVANVVEVEIDAKGMLRIPRVTVAVDCGLAVHPDRVRAQMEGSVVFATSLARSGAIHSEGGAIVEDNFDRYPIARNFEAPERIDIELMASTEAPTGVGEIGVPPFAPALANAIFDATGVRLRRLPLAGQELRPS